MGIKLHDGKLFCSQRPSSGENPGASSTPDTRCEVKASGTRAVVR